MGRIPVWSARVTCDGPEGQLDPFQSGGVKTNLFCVIFSRCTDDVAVLSPDSLATVVYIIEILVL